LSVEGVDGEQLPISLDGKKVDLTCPETIYWKYVQKVAPLHDSRSSSLSGPIVKAMQSIKDCKTVLDVCGGTGRIARYLVHSGHDVKVVDLSEDMLRIARRKGLDVDVQDARALKESSNSWDAVICLGNSLGGIPSKAGRMKAIREMARVSRERVVIDCANRLHDLARIWLAVHVRVLAGRLSTWTQAQG
jgi:ubiquinone/menaquinone biosynthesis C-methylase UbiE